MESMLAMQHQPWLNTRDLGSLRQAFEARITPSASQVTVRTAGDGHNRQSRQRCCWEVQLSFPCLFAVIKVCALVGLCISEAIDQSHASSAMVQLGHDQGAYNHVERCLDDLETTSTKHRTSNTAHSRLGIGQGKRSLEPQLVREPKM